MKVYKPGTRGRQRQYVQPGGEYPVAHFMGEDGKPKMFAITFTEGMAEVDDTLGQYMLDKGIARRSPILLPGD